MRVAAVLLAGVLSAVPARAAKVDVVVLQNGSSVVCEVKSKSGARVGTGDLGLNPWGRVRVEASASLTLGYSF